MKKLLFGLTTLGFLAFNVNAQEVQPQEKELKKYVHKLGLHAGTTTGAGISYKLMINGKHQIQIVTLPFASADSKAAFSGLQYRRKLRDLGSVWDFYLYGGAGHLYDYEKWGDGLTNGSFSEDHQFNGSLGMAFEFGPTEFFKFNIQTGYGIYDIGQPEWSTLPAIGISLDFAISKLYKEQ